MYPTLCQDPPLGAEEDEGSSRLTTYACLPLHQSTDHRAYDVLQSATTSLEEILPYFDNNTTNYKL
jgi:hypothetical protein